MRINTLLSSVILTPSIAWGADSAAVQTLLLQYVTAASTANPNLTTSSVDSDISADSLAAGTGITANFGTTWNWTAWYPAYTNFAEAVADGEFWQWGFDVN